ncbi:MAG: HepT-like ribonuclease domain-containing protein [Ignavibacteriaceae bacterium]
MKADDRIRIQHMADAGEEALAFAERVAKEDFAQNRMLILSVIKDIEIIGEAASRISEEAKLKFLNIPWKDIIGMRNRLIHGYFEVDIELIWNTIRNDLPPLMKSLKEILDNNK